MKNKKTYRLYRRGKGKTYYCQNNITGQQESLGTTNEEEAEEILHAKNKSSCDPTLNLNRALAEVYLRATDSLAGTRTWKEVMDEGAKGKGCCPTALRISQKGRPTSVSSLQTQ